MLLPGSLSQWSSSSLSRSSCPVLVTSHKEGETSPTHRVLTNILVKFKVWLWKRNINHNNVSIQNLCSIISSSKKFSDALWSLWKTLFNPRKLYWALYCKEMKIPIHVLANVRRFQSRLGFSEGQDILVTLRQKAKRLELRLWSSASWKGPWNHASVSI